MVTNVTDKYLKMKNFPNLSVDSAFTIVHEIGHALGLEHFSGGSLSQYTKFNILHLIYCTQYTTFN